MLLFAAAAVNTQPDYIALAMVLALAVLVLVMALRKRAALMASSAAAPAALAAQPEKPTAPGSAGQLKLHDVEPKTAAMLMAIVADKTGKPLNELRFISIKEVK